MQGLNVGDFTPATGAVSGDSRRRCPCGARIARDNREGECRPCQRAIFDQELESIQAAPMKVIAEANHRAEMRRTLQIWEVPLPSQDDPLDPDTLQQLVFQWARTGDPERVAQRVRLPVDEVCLAIHRDAATEMIEMMVEEGSWPEGAPTTPR